MDTPTATPEPTDSAPVYPIIDSKTDRHDILGEHTTVSLTLVQMGLHPARFGISYAAKWTGRFGHGQSMGGPLPVAGNMQRTIHPNPEIVLTISDYTDTGATISLHARLVVKVKLGPFSKSETLYDERLAGSYPARGFEGQIMALAEAAARQAAQPGE